MRSELKETWSCQRATRRPSTTPVTDANLRAKKQKALVVYSRQLSQLEQIIVHFGVYWLTLRLASSLFTSWREASSAPQTATCSDSQSGASVGDSHEDKTLHRRGSARAPREGCVFVNHNYKSKSTRFQMLSANSPHFCRCFKPLQPDRGN